MTLSQAKIKAQRVSNESGSSVLVYKSLLHPLSYDVAFTLPAHAERVGDHINPQTCIECGYRQFTMEDDGEGDGYQWTCASCHSRNIK